MATIHLLNTTVHYRKRHNCRTYASYVSKPKLHIFIKDWNMLEDLQGGRWNKPHTEFKKQVLNDALTQAGLDPTKVKTSWSQNAGCSCGCSPGFILTSIDPLKPNLDPMDIFCDYEVSLD